MVDDAYKDRAGWIAKSIRTTAKVRRFTRFTQVDIFDPIIICSDGQV